MKKLIVCAASLSLLALHAFAANPYSIGAGLAQSPLGVISTTTLLGNGGTPVTGTSYPIQPGDNATDLRYTGTSASAWTIVAPTTTGYGAGFSVTIVNDSPSGTITLTPSGSTIRGALSLSIAPNTQCNIVSDGTNYFGDACTAIVPGGGGGVTSVTGLGGGGISTINSSTTPSIFQTASSTSVTATSNTTLTASAIAGGDIQRSGPTAAFTDTTDTAANIIAALTTPQVGQMFWFTAKNTTAYDMSITWGSGITQLTTAHLISGQSGIWRFYVTSSSTLAGEQVGTYLSTFPASSIVANATTSASFPAIVTTILLNRYNLSGLTTTASGTGMSGCAASNCLALDINSAHAFEIDQNDHVSVQHLVSGSNVKPVVSACGGGTPAADANATDWSGSVTFGTGSPTSCLLTFTNAFTIYNHCHGEPNSALSGFYVTYNLTGITFNGASLSGTATYGCDGQ